MHEVLGPKRPIFVVGNKVDLLPRDSNGYLDHVKQCLKDEIIKTGFDRLNIKHVSLISAKTGYGVEELITQLQKIWAYNGDVYLVGCTNVGKSSLFNILLNSDYSRPQVSDLIPKATTCPWPGTTLQMLKFPIYRPSEIRIFQRFKRLQSEKFAKAEMAKLRLEKARKTGNIEDVVPMGTIGRTYVDNNAVEVADPFSMGGGTQPITTLNERSKEFQQARWLYDTPGVLHPDQITNLLTPKELMELQPKQMISPRAYRLKPGMSLFIGGLARLDFVGCSSEKLDWIQTFLFASFNLPTLIVKTDGAEEVYEKYLNSPLMHIPKIDEDVKRPCQWPGLQCHPQEFKVRGYILKPKVKELNCSADITLSSVGWVGLRIPVDTECSFKAWTPGGKGIYCRDLSLIPYAERLIGKKIRNSLAYNTSKPFIFKK
ncbi:nitric oxide-associated protein 1-like [Musca autumnalis]|uniref:nitric oxide-associated protein 1-like n=1 Tax=Musca autumnalis TaxID=221902 RepID=UPI003CF77D5A